MGIRCWGLLALAFLSSCGGGENDNHGYGWRYDAQTVSGIKVRYEADLATLKASGIDETYFEREFHKTVECTGLKAPPPPPYVVVLSDRQDTLCGRYLAYPPLIIVAGHPLCFRHEVVHHLLQQTMGDADAAHKSDLFGTCG